MQDTALALKAFSWSLEKIDILIAKYWVGQKVKSGKNTIRCYLCKASGSDSRAGEASTPVRTDPGVPRSPLF